MAAAKAKEVERAIAGCNAEGAGGRAGLQALQRLCIAPGGLASRLARARAWPILLGLERHEGYNGAAVGVETAAQHSLNMEHIHADQHQVELDVDRSFWRFPKGITPHQRNRLRRNITRILDAVLGADDSLHYYQGFHEICAILMLTCGDKWGYAMAMQLCRCHIMDYLMENMQASVAHCELMYAVLAVRVPELHAQLVRAGVPVGNLFDLAIFSALSTPAVRLCVLLSLRFLSLLLAVSVQAHFAISWVITWFAHDVDELDLICRIFDACLASHAFFPAYLAAAVVELAAPSLTALPEDLSTLHRALSELPKRSDFDKAIALADSTFRALPLARLIASAAMPQIPKQLLQASPAARHWQLFAQDPRNFDAALKHDQLWKAVIQDLPQAALKGAALALGSAIMLILTEISLVAIGAIAPAQDT